MAYQDSVKIRAYALFIQGKSYEETARILAKDFQITITPNTIKNWAEKKDSRGGTWIDYRTDTRAVAMQTVEVVEKNRLIKIRDKADTLQEKLYNQLTAENAPKVGSSEGGLYAWKAVAEFLIKLDQKSQEDVSIVAVVQMMLEIFAEVPEVRKVIQKHWPAIEKEIRIRILHENPDDVSVHPKKIGEQDV